MNRVLIVFLAFTLLACQPGLDAPGAALDLRTELVSKTGDTPPKAPEGACWAEDVTPAIIETVTEQVLISPEMRDPEGGLISAAVFRTETQQEIVQDRRAVWFRTPCPAQMSVELIATLQRALKARGLYRAALTGKLDSTTRLAIRKYQEPLGLDSEHLSLAAARSLGLIAGDFGR